MRGIPKPNFTRELRMAEISLLHDIMTIDLEDLPFGDPHVVNV
ncbi:hypothetical protein [Thermococcus sp. GR6]|nr:hypothetical protein [Thermococcus sp. GR6]